MSMLYQGHNGRLSILNKSCPSPILTNTLSEAAALTDAEEVVEEDAAPVVVPEPGHYA